MLTVDTSHDLDAFLDSWTASHELSHLLLPYISRREAWLGEGFASYYQNVLRARAGMLSQREAWQKLHAGFERGLEKWGEISQRRGRGPQPVRRAASGATTLARRSRWPHCAPAPRTAASAARIAT